MKRIISTIYILGFMAMLVIPLLFTNRDGEAISLNENRPLAKRPPIKVDGKLNPDLLNRIEDYFDDRIGFRDELILINARLQYYVFGRMENSDRYRLGPNGEFNRIEEGMVSTYQHKNLFNDDELEQLSDSFNAFESFLEGEDCKFVFVDCYDKESICPEYFPQSVIQYGDISRTDQFMAQLKEHSNVNVVDLKPLFMDIKDEYEIYAPYGDPIHWTPRGAYIGYTEIMKAINEECDNEYRILSEDDFDISITNQGMEFFGGVTHPNYSEDFVLKQTNAKLIEDPSAYYTFPDGKTAIYRRNDNADNDSKLMIWGNSFIRYYNLFYFAESFGETLFIAADPDASFADWVRTYNPDVVIYEVAERYTDYDEINKAASFLMDK